MKRSLTAVGVLLALLIPGSSPPAASDVLPHRFEGTVEMGYDSNVLDGSDAEIQAFHDNDPGSFFIIDNPEGTLLQARLRGRWKLGKPLGMKTQLLAGYKRTQYLHTSVKNENAYSVEIRTQADSRTRVSLRTRLRPQIYGRHRRDKDALPGAPLFRAEEHRRWDLDLGLNRTLGERWQAQAGVKRVWRSYTWPFRERNRRQLGASAGLGWDAGDRFGLEVEGTFRRSVSQNDPYLGSDLSYRQWGLEPRLRVQRISGLSEVVLSANIVWRTYTSQDPDDDSHYLRHDRIGSVEVFAAREVTRFASMTVRYVRNWRNAELELGDEIDFDEEGSSSEHIVLVGLSFEIRP